MADVHLILAELERWRQQGLIDESTHGRLVALYPVLPALDLADSDPRLLDAQLEQEARFVSQVEAQDESDRRAEQAARDAACVPPEMRSASLPDAAAATVAEVAAVHVAEPPLDAAGQVLVREASFRSRLRLMLFENVLWIAGGLLIVFGSLYFLGLIWDSLESWMIEAVIAVSLDLYAAGFFAAGWMLCRRDAHRVGRTLFCFSMALLPLGSVATGELFAAVTGVAPVVVAIVLGLLMLAVQGPMVAIMGGLFERRSVRPLVVGTIVLALSTSLVAMLQPLLVVALMGVAVAALAWALLDGARWLQLRMSALFVGLALLWSFMVFAGRAAAALGGPVTHYAPLVGLVAALLIACDARMRARNGAEPRMTVVGIVLHGVVLLALALSLGGLGFVGYFDLGARLAVLASAIVAVVVFLRAARLHGRSAMTHLAAGAGLIAYFFLPSPFIRALAWIERSASSALGYTDQPLPLAYYGVTFLPYLLLLGFVAHRLAHRRADLSRDLVHFVIAIGALAALLAGTQHDDVRAMLWTWPLYAAGAWTLAVRFRRRVPAYGAQLLVVGSCLALGVHVQSAAIALLALACVAAVQAGYALRAGSALASVASTGAALGCSCAFAIGFVVYPSWVPLAAASALVALTFISPHIWLAGIAGIAWAAGAAATAAAIDPRAWPPTLLIVACAMLAVTRDARPHATANFRVWRFASLIVALAGIVACIPRLAPGMDHAASWGLLAATGAALYALVALNVYQRERPRRAANLMMAIAFWFACAIAFAIEVFFVAGFDTRLSMHGAAFAMQCVVWSTVVRRGAQAGVVARGQMVALLLVAFPTAIVALGLLLIVAGSNVDAAFLLCAVATAAALRVVPRLERLARPLSVCVVALLPAFIAAWLGAPVSFWLAIGALGLRASIHLGWSLSIFALALMATHAHIGQAALVVSLLAIMLVIAWRCAEAATARRFARAAALCVVSAVGLAAVWLASELSTGRHPKAAVLLPIAAAWLVASVAFRAFAARSSLGGADEWAKVSRAMLPVAASLSLAALLFCGPPAMSDVRVAGFATAIAAFVLMCAWGRSKAWLFDVAIATGIAIYAVARHHGFVGSSLGDALLLAATVHGAFWVSRERAFVASRALDRAAIGLPAIAVVIMPQLSATDATLVGLLLAVHYAVTTRVTDRKWLTIPASMFATATLFCAWSALGLTDVLAYALPSAIALLFLVHVYAEELGPARTALRAVILAAIYALSLATTFTQDPLRGLVIVPLVCVVGIVAGAVLRVRLYLTLGVVFLAVDLAAEMLRHGLANRPLGALFLTLLGLGLVVTMVFISLDRERVMRRYAAVLGELRTWD